MARHKEKIMHINQAMIALTSNDHKRLLAQAYCHAESAPRATERLMWKLRNATLFEPEELPDDVVSMNSIVRYRVDGEAAARGALVFSDDGTRSELEISVLTALGTALLGQRVGERIPLDFQETGRPRWVQIESIDPGLQGGMIPVQPKRLADVARSHG
jgi:regulator of nucleoside diphosphate kinase